jgi:hypothetical protein
MPFPTIQKKANETRTIVWDFSEPAAGDAIVGDAMITGPEGGLVSDALMVGEPDTPSGLLISVDVGGGVDGTAYELHCIVDTANGQRLDLGCYLLINDSEN